MILPCMSDTDMVNRSGKQSEAIENWELVTGFGYMMVLFSPDADKGNFTEVDFISSQRDHTKAKVSPVEFDVILYSLSVSETRTHSGGIASRAIHTVSLRKKKNTD